MKPMLAATATLAELIYPLWVSPKLDGIRGLVKQGKLLSRSLKPIRNKATQKCFSVKQLNGLDGELILGSPTASDVYRKSQQACNTIGGDPDVLFYVFDYHDMPSCNFEERLFALEEARVLHPRIRIVPHTLVDSERALLSLETRYLDEGYEGLILRSPTGLYKYGRSTVKQQGMMKLKRFVDSEAEILSVFEEMENQNEAETNALGRTERSSAKAGMVGKGRAGGFEMRDIYTHVEFRCGTGLDDAAKKKYWEERETCVGEIHGYKSFPVGVKDKPRHPVWKGPRERWDLS